MSIIRADARQIPLADESVSMVCTSPPYWNLRNYSVEGQIGLEKSIDAYIQTLVGVFEEVKRILHPSGCVFINIADSYSGSMKGYSPSGPGYGGLKQRTNIGSMGLPPSRVMEGGPKAKDLCLIPERLAIALQSAGWYVRSRIAWVKPAPMPESVTDRPTSAWEHLWLLAKRPDYFWDAEAVREPLVGPLHNPGNNGKRFDPPGRSDGHHWNADRMDKTWGNPAGRNLRNWWVIGPDPSSEAYCVACDLMYERSPHGQVCARCRGKLTAHYAAFPRDLVRRCIAAGSPERGVCAACGMPWVRVVKDSDEYAAFKASHPGAVRSNNLETLGLGSKLHTGRVNPSISADKQTLGWRAQCQCKASTRPALIYDPFGGTNTTGLVAQSMGRRWVVTELSWEYCRYSQRRAAQGGLFTMGAAK